MLGWFSTGLEITMFNKKDHNLFLSFEIIVKFSNARVSPNRYSKDRSTYFRPLGGENLSMISALFKEPKTVPF